MTKHPFLSDGWFDEVRRLHDAVGGAAPEGADIRMNLMITATPFDGDLPMHMSAAGGRADWGKGHLDDADVTLTLGYDTARAIFVDGNPQAAIEAFMAGKDHRARRHHQADGDAVGRAGRRRFGADQGAAGNHRIDRPGWTRPCPEGVGHPGPVAAGEHHPALADAPTPPGHGTLRS